MAEIRKKCNLLSAVKATSFVFAESIDKKINAAPVGRVTPLVIHAIKPRAGNVFLQQATV